ncbi:MAG: 2Fe-2S ferredoxin [Candidatus Azotimanducaceae bacterium]|jgi:2Fe-2S ferredoxin
MIDLNAYHVVMTKVQFVLASGERMTFKAKQGDSILDVALDNGVAGIHGQCGGGCTCCTCHCYVAGEWLAKLDEPCGDEAEMLEYAWQPGSGSRLACQVALGPHLDGIEVRVPAQQS